MTETIGYCTYCTEPKQLAVVHNPGDTFVRCLSCGARGPKAKDMNDAVLLWNAASNALTVERQALEAVKAERDTLLDERNVADARVAELYEKCNSFEILWLAAVKDRDEARRWARRLWREKQTNCSNCGGAGKFILVGEYRSYLATCKVCHGTGKVTK